MIFLRYTVVCTGRGFTGWPLLPRNFGNPLEINMTSFNSRPGAPASLLSLNSRAQALRAAAIETLETRVHLSASVESIDGTGNNLSHSNWGSAGTDLLRLAKAAYVDGVSEPALPGDRSARAISNILNSQANPKHPSTDLATVDGKSLSDFGYAFGQFMDHDLDLTPDGGARFDIPVAADDPIGPNGLPFTRSLTDPATGTSKSNPLQQVTVITAYLDLSQVYGSNQTVSDALRTFQNGLLKTSPGNMLPYDNSTYFTSGQIAALNMANDAQAVATSALFATGDRRGNENLELTAMQTLFLRNHNRIAGLVQKSHPGWSDEQIFQEARKLNIAEYQQIIYTGWIPAVLGGTALPAYKGYKPNVNASISTEFSTVAFRFGHSLLSAIIERLTNSGADIHDVNPKGADISLAQDFFDPNLLNPTGAVDPLTGHTSSDIGPVLKAQASGVSQATDLLAVSEVRNLLFGNGGFGGEDLIARDVQRDRDNGIPNYNTLRVALGLPAVTSFSQISSDPTVQKELAKAYPGGVKTIDAFEGGLAEADVAGSDVGPLFQAIMVDQFKRLRNGDRFFYGNQTFTPDEQRILQAGNTLSEVIKANTNITNLQRNAFVYKALISGTVSGLAMRHVGFGIGGYYRVPCGVADLKVLLKNDDGTVIATTYTDRDGHYTFNQLSGPSANREVSSGVSGAGTYRVVLVLPSDMTQLPPAPKPVVISTGDTYVQNVNFNVNYLTTHILDVWE